MNMLVGGAALLLACGALFAHDLISVRQSMVDTLTTQTEMAGTNVISAMIFNDADSASRTLSALAAAPNIVSAVLYTTDGRPFAAYWRDQRREPPKPLLEISHDQNKRAWCKDGQLISFRRLFLQEKFVGTIVVRSDLREINLRLRRYSKIVAAVL